jgi:hypothetical protein
VEVCDADSSNAVQLRVGWLSRHELRVALDRSGVLLNASAEVLLDSEIFERQRIESFQIVQCTVGQLGIRNGGTLSSIFSRAREAGLSLCPNITGPYLRLARASQESAPDSQMSNGSAPSGSITVASAPLDDDDVLPKGFYLRAVDDVLWLRGYHATEGHIWSPDDCFAFRTLESAI